MKIIKRSAGVMAIITVLLVTSGWGFLVHRTVHQLAVYELPKKMRKFYYRNLDSLVSHSTRPDIRRNTDSLEASKHFIDLEAYGDSAAFTLPLHWDEAEKIYSKDTLLKYGYVPYHILTMKDKLTEAFKSGIADSILFYSADLGHYIADANVPLHTSINYDGQLTNQKGLHSLWESVVPDIEISNYTLYANHKAQYLVNPAEDIMNSIRRANNLLPDVFAKEKEISAKFTDSTKYIVRTRNGREYKNYSPAFARAYAAALKTTVNDQLLHSANQVADFWYTCWVDAGKPDLKSTTNPPYTKLDRRALRRQYKAYKRNNLIADSLLIARKQLGN